MLSFLLPSLVFLKHPASLLKPVCAMMFFSRWFQSSGLSGFMFLLHPASLIRTQLTMAERNLSVKNMTFVFEPASWPLIVAIVSWCNLTEMILLICFWKKTCEDSVYGKREGALSGLCIMSAHRKNVFRQSRAFKTGVVHGISMLQRSDMVKPESVTWNKYQNLRTQFRLLCIEVYFPSLFTDCSQEPA